MHDEDDDQPAEESSLVFWFPSLGGGTIAGTKEQGRLCGSEIPPWIYMWPKNVLYSRESAPYVE